ncbi:MAG: hypothetical protein ACLTMP_05670 [Eggerthella lenta]
MQNATAVPRDGGSGVPAVRTSTADELLIVLVVVGRAVQPASPVAVVLRDARCGCCQASASRRFVAVLAAVALAEWGAGFIPNATVAGMVGFSSSFSRAVYVCADRVDVGGVAHR